MNFYSQFGEDKYLVDNYELPEVGVFVDVGAGGTHNSNSLHFEEKGWTVLCIEPDKRHEGLEKRRYVDNSVVGSKEGEVEFVFHRHPELSGLYHDKATAVKLPMHTLNTLLEKHGLTEQYGIDHIDILSVDVEGNEIDVLKGLDFERFKPSFVIIEHTNQFKGNKQLDTRSMLENEGYEQVYITQSNLIMKRKEV